MNNFDINNEFDFDKVIELVKKMRRPKPIEDSLKKEGEIIIMKGSKPFKKGEIDKIITDITSQLTKDEITKGYATRYEGNYTYILYYDKNGKHTMGKFKTNERLYDENR